MGNNRLNWFTEWLSIKYDLPQETTDAHNKLQSHLSKTMQEIYDQEKHIQGLRKALRDKEAPLKVNIKFFLGWCKS